MARGNRRPGYRNLAISMVLSTALVALGLATVDTLNVQGVANRLLLPLSRLIFFIAMGLVVGQVVEASGWTRYLAAVAAPMFRFGNLGRRCSAAFTTAFFSGVAANAMLLEFYKEKKISRQQLFLANFVNQLPSYFLHLPTTFFIVVPLTRIAGITYFALTFAATLLRTVLFLVYGHFHPAMINGVEETGEEIAPRSTGRKTRSMWDAIKKRFPARIVGVATWVLPIYTAVFLLNVLGLFEAARQWLAGFVVTTFMPVEALSVVILSFAAEFSSGFAAAGALLDAGVITVKQTVMALLIGNIIAFPIRALRHQLPRYMGIYSPKMGAQLLFMGQGFRIVSLIAVGIIFYIVA